MSLDQIARDMREGAFPKKSEATLREEATFAIVVSVLEMGAPGLSKSVREALAMSIAMKIEAAR